MTSARLRLLTAVVVLALSSLGGVAAHADQAPPRQDAGEPLAGGHPWAERVAAARRFASHRQGDVGFAVVDEQGTVRGYHLGARFESASVIKVMLMAAYLRQGSVRDRDLDDADRRLMGPMIKRSANGPASAIYQRVGAGALYKLAREAGMKGFSPTRSGARRG